MILNPVTRQNRTLLFSFQAFLISQRSFSSSLPLSSNPKQSRKKHNPNPTTIKRRKPSHRPQSSLYRTARKPLHSNLPFDFRYSYTESGPLPSTGPIRLREPKFSPFGPGRIDRDWDGICAPAIFDPATKSVGGDGNSSTVDAAQKLKERILGAPLSDAEKRYLVEKSQRNPTRRQVNLGRDGLTHNMLNVIHNHWKHEEAIRIKCMGVPTVDMENVCTHLEDKTGGRIILMQGGLIVLYRGRHYNPKKRPMIPIMLWKPSEPIYPRLIRRVLDGLTAELTMEMRRRGLATPALTALAKNGFYGNLVPMVQEAFLTDELVHIDCKSLDKSDYRKIGCKLRDLVPCVLVTFEEQQIVIWRGKDYTSRTEPVSEDE